MSQTQPLGRTDEVKKYCRLADSRLLCFGVWMIPLVEVTSLVILTLLQSAIVNVCSLSHYCVVYY